MILVFIFFVVDYVIFKDDICIFDGLVENISVIVGIIVILLCFVDLFNLDLLKEVCFKIIVFIELVLGEEGVFISDFKIFNLIRF